MAQGTTSLLSNTVYAISDATSQFSRAAHKVLGFLDGLGRIFIKLLSQFLLDFNLQGIVAFTFDDQTVTMIERQQKGMSSHSKGVINEFLEVLFVFLCDQRVNFGFFYVYHPNGTVLSPSSFFHKFKG